MAREVTIAGAGLVGSLMSIYLARRGHRVTVWERREDLRRAVAGEGRSINLAISERGLHALRQVGLEDDALRHAIPMRGRVMHAHSGELSFQAYGKDDSQCIHSISRAWLNGMLMSEAEKTSRVRIRFGERVDGVDFEEGAVEVVEEATGETRAHPAPALIGTDGAGSAVRRAIVARLGGKSDEAPLDYGYKELILPAGPNGSFRLEKHALHIWPRGKFMLIALPNEDGSFTCTLFLPFEGELGFAALKTPEQVGALFDREFPDVVPHLPNLAEEYFAHPTGNMVTVRCAPWNAGGRALLLGDAAHAIVPFYGQGMNAGFEDCVVLDGLLESGLDFEQAFSKLSRERKADADAIADMALDNFVEMRDRVAAPRFLLGKQIEKKLLNAFPGRFLSRYSLVSFSRVPYRIAFEVGEIAERIVSELSEGLDDAERVDMGKAEALIRERLDPFIAAHLS